MSGLYGYVLGEDAKTPIMQRDCPTQNSPVEFLADCLHTHLFKYYSFLEIVCPFRLGF